MSTKARWRCLEATAALVAVLAVAPPVRADAAAARGTGAGAGVALEPLVVGLTLNGSAVSDAQLLYRSASAGDGRLWLDLERASAWRIDAARRPQRTIGGVGHVELCTGADRCVLDESSALATIELRTADFLPLRLGAAAPAAAASGVPAASGGYLNYDLGTWKHGDRPGVSGLVSGHVYGAWGQGALEVAAVRASGRGSRSLGRAVWQVDEPERGRSWQIGSVAVPDTALGAGLPLTGVRVGSNRFLHPTLPPVLRPLVDGVADRSTRTDLFVDGQYRQTALVPYGPYSIELLPQFTGRGDIDVVSTDPSGVKTRTTIPYYQSPAMLAPGRNEWSLDVGRLAGDGSRRLRDADHPAVASAWWRRGVSSWLTAQGQVLAGRRAARVAGSVDTVDPRLGASTLALTWQTSPAQRGGRVWLGAGHEYLSRDLSASIRTEQLLGRCRPRDSEGALSDRLARPCRHASATFGGNIGVRWSAAATAGLLRDADGRRSSVAAFNLRWQVEPLSQVALTLQRVRIDGRSVTVANIGYTRPLGGRHSVQTNLQQRGDDGTSLQWAAQRTMAADSGQDGPRWQAFGSAGGRQTEVGARWVDDAQRFAWRAEARAGRHGASGAAGIDGALGFAEGRVFASRRIDDAFIVVDAGLPGLPVLLDNRQVATTDGDGRAVVTGARARQENSIGVDVSALPIQYAMPRDQLNVVPHLGSGALARFDLSDGGLSLPVRDADGAPLPAGATASVSTQSLGTAVTSRSEVFIDRSDRAATVTIEWPGRRCVLAYVPQQVPAEGYRCAR